jgi:hypothetical protein
MFFEKFLANRKKEKRRKIIKYNLKIFLLFTAVVMVWRSIW